MNDQDRIILTRFFIGLALVLVLILLAWLVFFRHPGNKNTSQQTKPGTGSSQPAPQSASQPTHGNPSPPSSGSKPSSTGTAGTSNGNSSASPAPASGPAAGKTGSLTNTGPGDNLFFLFIGVSATAGLVHYLYRQRPHKKEAV